VANAVPEQAVHAVIDRRRDQWLVDDHRAGVCRSREGQQQWMRSSHR
jgi:hypothetical protein